MEGHKYVCPTVQEIITDQARAEKEQRIMQQMTQLAIQKATEIELKT